MGVDEVEARIVDAVELMARLPDRDRARRIAGDGPWGQIVRDPYFREGGEGGDWVDLDQVAETLARPRGGLSSVEVDRMEEALEWVTRFVAAKGQLRRLVGAVAGYRARHGGQVDWAEVRRSGALRGSNDVLRKSYARALAGIARGVNGGKAHLNHVKG